MKNKKLRSDFLCVDILYLKNYIISLINENVDNNVKLSIVDLLDEVNKCYIKYQSVDYIEVNTAIRDFTYFKESIGKLHIRKTNNKNIIEKYDDICFFISESKKLYNSDFIV